MRHNLTNIFQIDLSNFHLLQLNVSEIFSENWKRKKIKLAMLLHITFSFIMKLLKSALSNIPCLWFQNWMASFLEVYFHANLSSHESSNIHTAKTWRLMEAHLTRKPNWIKNGNTFSEMISTHLIIFFFLLTNNSKLGNVQLKRCKKCTRSIPQFTAKY